ncbi:MAG TPA: epoxyqueuosine reductase QueH [Thermoleophilia bacterium]|nr:epoxyqueuosine reductase QueH [Thermoleophilia bacterium]
MDDLFLHACCGPCATVAVPAWRAEGLEPRLWFWNPNIQPAVEHERRRQSLLRFAAAEELAVVGAAPAAADDAAGCADERAAPVRVGFATEAASDGGSAGGSAWRAWAASLSATPPEARCAACLRLRMADAAAAAVRAGAARFSTTLSVSPYQRHDLIRLAGREAAELQGVEFIYVDLRPRFRESYAESRRLGLYRQVYCGCAASKWEAWHQRRARRSTR